MKNHIEKLLCEYTTKIENCDKIIDRLTARRSKAKAHGNDSLMAVCREEIAVAIGRRQAVVQAKTDIDSLRRYDG